MKFTNCQRLTSPVMMGIKSSCRRHGDSSREPLKGLLVPMRTKRAPESFFGLPEETCMSYDIPSKKGWKSPFYPRMISQIPWSKRTSDFVWLQLDPGLKSAATT